MAGFDDIKRGKNRHANSPKITKFKIGDEFLKILQDNTFNGMNGEDVTNHVARVLEITEWIKKPNVEKNVLRLHVFSKSLSGDAEKWWNDEIEGKAIGWNETCNKFCRKYYSPSHSSNSKGIYSDTNPRPPRHRQPGRAMQNQRIHFRLGMTKNSLLLVQTKFVLLKELLAACLTSTTNSSAEKIADGRLAKERIARTSSNFLAKPCCK
ncbi:hypothetical protein Tco_1096455 [Tanacetum coccineum]